MRARRDRDARGHGVPDPLRVLAVAAARRPALPATTTSSSASTTTSPSSTAGRWWADVGHTLILTVISVGIELVLGMLLALVMHRAIFGRGLVRTAVAGPLRHRHRRRRVRLAARLLRLARAASSPSSLNLDDRPADADLVRCTWSRSSPRSGRRRRSWRCCCSPASARSPTSCTRPRASTAPRAWQRFWKITVPLIKPAILVAILFRTLDAFRIFDTIFVLTASTQNRVDRDGLQPRLQLAADPAQPGRRLGDLRAHLPDGRADRVRLHQAARRQPAAGERLMRRQADRSAGAPPTRDRRSSRRCSRCSGS